jgi:hypothetical protein
MAIATLLFIRFRFALIERLGDYILLRGPVAEIDQLTTLGAKREKFFAGRHRPLADGALQGHAD